MVISKLDRESDGWYRFNLNVGGFTIRNCRWHPPTRRILFPVRYDRSTPPRRHKVIYAYGAHVKRLRSLLESGQNRGPRDRRPCILKICNFRSSLESNRKLNSLREWLIFDFTVRGFTILGCRWLPDARSIQLPVTFYSEFPKRTFLKKPVVCAYGAHIKRLRIALEAAAPQRMAARAA